MVELLAGVLKTSRGIISIVLLLRHALVSISRLACVLGVLLCDLFVDEAIFGRVIGIWVMWTLGVHDLVESVDARTLPGGWCGSCYKFLGLTLVILVIGTSTSSCSRRIFLGFPGAARLLRCSDSVFYFGILIGLFKHLLDCLERLVSKLAD